PIILLYDGARRVLEPVGVDPYFRADRLEFSERETTAACRLTRRTVLDGPPQYFSYFAVRECPLINRRLSHPLPRFDESGLSDCSRIRPTPRLLGSRVYSDNW